MPPDHDLYRSLGNVEARIVSVEESVRELKSSIVGLHEKSNQVLQSLTEILTEKKTTKETKSWFGNVADRGINIGLSSALVFAAFYFKGK